MTTFEKFYGEQTVNEGIKSIAASALLGASLISAPGTIKNHNPGNIRSTTKWDGMVGSEKGFAKFKSPEWGVRALTRLLKTYYTKYNLQTVEGIISRWAPPQENNTQQYIKFVCSKLSVQPKQKLNLFDSTGKIQNRNLLIKLIQAISQKEHSETYDAKTVDKGIELASK